MSLHCSLHRLTLHVCSFQTVNSFYISNFEHSSSTRKIQTVNSFTLHACHFIVLEPLPFVALPFFSPRNCPFYESHNLQIMILWTSCLCPDAELFVRPLGRTTFVVGPPSCLASCITPVFEPRVICFHLSFIHVVPC